MNKLFKSPNGKYPVFLVCDLKDRTHMYFTSEALDDNSVAHVFQYDPYGAGCLDSQEQIDMAIEEVMQAFKDKAGENLKFFNPSTLKLCTSEEFHVLLDEFNEDAEWHDIKKTHGVFAAIIKKFEK